MKRLAIAAFVFFLLISAVLPCTAQQKEKRRPDQPLIYGPVHTIRDESATVTMKNGEPVEGPRTLVQIATYSEDGTQQEHILYFDGSVVTKIVDVYDTDGKILETTRFNGKGDMQLREVSHYDDQKKLIELIRYWPDGLVTSRLKFVYNGNQRITESVNYKRDGSVLNQSTTTTDMRANRSETLSYNADRVSRSERSTTRTPEGGQMYEIQEDGKTTLKEAYNPIEKGGDERIQYNPDGTVKSRERFTPEFDSHGNMIKITRSVATGDSTDFVLTDVTYRTIEYYQ
jgi:hypothetical protein